MTNLPQTLTLAGLSTNPRQIAFDLYLPGGETGVFRLLERGDVPILGAYFLGLSAETTGHYGPHPFDQATADRLCAALDYADTMRWIAVLNQGSWEQVIGYFILVPAVGQPERERFAALGLPLDPAADCTLAPSLADAYQSRGLGTLLLGHLKEVTRRMGFRRMVLMGGVHASNPRAIRYYEKNGFRKVGEFEHPPGVMNFDMVMFIDPDYSSDSGVSP